MIPDRKNRDAWWAFLEGAPESVWNPSRPTEQGRKRGGGNHEGVFTTYSGQILPTPLMKPPATQQPSSVTPSDDGTPQKPRELTPMQLFYIDHVCLSLLDVAGTLTARLNPALLSSSYHVLYALVQLVS